MIYTYNYTDFLNVKIDLNRLINEIKKSIDTPLQQIILNDDNKTCQIIFEINLTKDETILLNNIVSNHTGEVFIIEDLSIVKIKEHEGKTGGHFQSTMISFFISGDTEYHVEDFSFPYEVSIFCGEWHETERHYGDVADFLISPDTLVGYITDNYDINNDIWNVDANSLNYLQKGYWIEIDDEELGRIISIDKSNFTIKTENKSKKNHHIGEYIKMTIKLAYNQIMIGNGGVSSIGRSKIGSEDIPANTTLRIIYYNNNKLDKYFGVRFDYLY